MRFSITRLQIRIRQTCKQTTKHNLEMQTDQSDRERGKTEEQVYRHTFRYIIKEAIIAKPALQLRLPEVVVRVDEAGRDDFVSAVDCLDTSIIVHTSNIRNGRGNSFDSVSLDQDIRIAERDDMLVLVVEEDGAVLEENNG